MTRRHTSPAPLAHTTTGDTHREHALRVPCPGPPRGCSQPVGSPCLRPDGQELAGPGHAHRLIAADLEHPTEIPPDPPDPAPAAPARRLVSADRMRTDLATRREPCPNGCGTTIVWARNPRGDLVPVDADPIPPAAAGRREPTRLRTLTVDGDGTVLAVIVSPGAVPGARAHGTPLHQAHRQTCTRAHMWSRHRRR